ncbi:MAG: ABC transporter permease subunit [Candidatus Cloacimonetes bacterium]|nr:ABC transporter permease subunit [Candidatus Cloacimonadota bacterium]
MGKTSVIYRKEMSTFFNAPSAYIVLVFFLILAAWFFTSPLFINMQADMSSLFSIVPILYLFFIPAITMGTLSKEKSNGTIETLATLPLTDSEVVMGKFWASLAFVGTGLLFTLVHFFTILILGTNVDVGAAVTGYLGLVLIGAVYTAIGIFASSVTTNQILAFIIGFFISLFFFFIGYSLIFIPSGLVGIFQYLSINYHFSNISKGVIDSRNLVYFFSLIALFLRMAVIVMEARKWK